METLHKTNFLFLFGTYLYQISTFSLLMSKDTWQEKELWVQPVCPFPPVLFSG